MQKFITLTALIFLAFYGELCFGQNKVLVERFVIQSAKNNKVDSTSSYLQRKAYLVMEKDKSDGQLYFRVVEAKEDLTKAGKAYDFRAKFYDKTVHSHKAEFITFRWNYDQDNETAFVAIWRVHKPQGTTFECTILYRNSDVIDLEGILEGAVPDVESAYHLTASSIVHIEKE